jgi:hypothetical protein
MKWDRDEALGKEFDFDSTAVSFNCWGWMKDN